jgi:hypothetical protein
LDGIGAATGTKEEIMTSPPKDDPLATVAGYIVKSEARYALMAARLRKIREEGRDASTVERALRDLEETLDLLRQRHWSLQIEARSRRLLTFTREKLSDSRPQTTGPRVPSHGKTPGSLK